LREVVVVLAVLEVEDKKEEVAYKGLEVVSVMLVVVDSVADGEGLKLEPEIEGEVEGVIVVMVVVIVVIVVMVVMAVTVVTMVVHEEREVVLASWGRSPDVDRVGFLVGELDGDSGISEVIT
jgi:carbon starvation protein CstA